MAQRATTTFPTGRCRSTSRWSRSKDRSEHRRHHNVSCGDGNGRWLCNKSILLDDSQNNNNNNGLQAATPNLANSPLAQFFNSNNFNHAPPRQPAEVKVKAPKEKTNGQKVSAPPGFKAQPPKNLLAKETKLITPTMFASNSEKKPPAAEPLTKNQLFQALNYLIENDDEFMKKVHEAYVKSFTVKTS